ncbi:MAG: VOC family protein [Cyclobacteriaceae bacterium]
MKKVFPKSIDHLVYAVPDLDKAIDEFEIKLGVRPIFGGYHKTQGTKNALINLTNNCYLELLAVDHSNAEIKPPRWMGIDVLSKSKMTRWALRSDSLEKDSKALKVFNTEMGDIGSGSRNTADGSLLKWKLTMPLALPEVELTPFLIDWSKTERHPSDLLPDMGCELIDLYGSHPNPEHRTLVFSSLGVRLRIEQSQEVVLKAIIGTPNGIVEL